MKLQKYLSIFSPATKRQREENFENYWQFTQRHGRKLYENDQDLAKKRRWLKYFRDNPAKFRRPFASDAFYRNYVKLKDDSNSLNRVTFMLLGIYKSRHEWVGIRAA